MLAPRVFPLLQYCQETLQSLKKFLFQYFNTNESKNIQLCIHLVENKLCYATHCKDVGKASTPFWTRLKTDAELQTQRPTEIPIHYRDKLRISLDALQENEITEKIGSTLHEPPNYGTLFLSPLIKILKKITSNMCWTPGISTQAPMKFLNLGYCNV